MTVTDVIKAESVQLSYTYYMEENDDIIKWSSPEFHFVERTATWYLVSIIAALAISVFAISQKNFLFLAFVIIGELVVLFLARQTPRLYTYTLHERGIVVGGRLVYEFKAMKRFAMVDEDHERYVELVLHPTKQMSQYVKILVPRDTADVVYAVFKARMPEFSYEPTATEVLMRRIGL